MNRVTWWASALSILVLVGCGDSSTNSSSPPSELRLGYFPNVTHAPAIVGVVNGHFGTELGEVELKTLTFNAGGEAVEAMFSDAIDMTFIGPNPAINAFAQSAGEAVRIVSGATSGGAFLVVRSDIDEVSDLAGTTLSSPALGNTQDVALRAWLLDQGFATDAEGGGDVSIFPQSNAQTLETFQSGEIDGAWVPEPWATRLILEGGGKILVDERDLWEGGRFVTTHLLVRTEFLEEKPEIVEAVLRGLVQAIDHIQSDPADAQRLVSENIAALTGSTMAPETMVGAWANLEFTVDPLADSLRGSAEDAASVGLLEPVDLDGIYALELLNEILTGMGRDEVSS